MAYQCRQCNTFGNEAGVCPVCNIPMDIKLQNDMPDTTPVVPVVPAEETPVVPEAPMPKVATEETPAPGAPAEGGDPTLA